MEKLLVIYGSSRKNGNSEALTKMTLKQMNREDYQEIFLMDYHLEPIIDERHTLTGFNPVNDDYETLIKQVMGHEAILFATPLYWYGMPGRLKNFIDRFSQSLRNKDYNFKESMQGKKMYVIIAGGQSAPLTALPLIQQFQLISQFLAMEFAGYVIGKGVKPLEVLEDEESILAAKQLGIKISLDNFMKNKE